MYGTIQRFPARRLHPLGTWSEDARAALQANPEYFMWWYTVKSVGLCAVVAFAAYQVGRRHGERQ